MVEGKFLGKREPVDRPTLQLGDFMRAEGAKIPAHPQASPVPPVAWTMDRNDQAGVCVVAGLNHTLQAVAESLGQRRTPWSDAEILERYRTQNPDFRDWSQGGTDADQGMVIQTFLEDSVARGDILAFAKIDHENHELMRAATFIGGGIMTGEMLREDHEDLRLWDASSKPKWGGHCTTTVGYASDYMHCVTWGQVTPYTQGFAEKHMDEAWFVLTPAMVNSSILRSGLDLPGLAAAVADLTDGKVIVPVPPVISDMPPSAPVDNPAPVPADPAWDGFPFQLLDDWAAHAPKADQKYERQAKLAYRQWKADHRVDARRASTRRVVYDAQGQQIGEIELGTGSFWASQS